MNVSTIMPYTMQHRNLEDILMGNTEVYYSLYSTNNNFRKEWMPQAMPYPEALTKLKRYQQYSHKPITLHWAFIQGHNDNLEDIQKMTDIITEYQMFGKFNIVRYNPPPNLKHTREPSEEELSYYLSILRQSLLPYQKEDRSKIVPRVGKDVFASCGTFITDC